MEERFDLSDALAVATYLNGFIRQCRTVKLANLAQLVNAIAPIFTSKQGLFLQTIYHPLRLYAEHTLDTALDVHVDSPTYDLPPEQEGEGWGECTTCPTSVPSFEQPYVVGARERQVEAKGGRLDYEFPARSVSVLRMRLR